MTSRKSSHTASRKSSSSRKSTAARISFIQKKLNTSKPSTKDAKMGDKMNAKMNAKMGDKMNAKMNAKMGAKMNAKMNAKMGAKMNAKMNAKMGAKMNAKMLQTEANTLQANQAFTGLVYSPYICSTQYPELIRFLVTNDAYFGPETDQDAQNKDISVTARSKELYYKHLFPEHSTEAKVTKQVSGKRIIDIGCGYNPLYERSFIHHFKDKARVEGMDIIPLKMPRYKCVSLFELSDHCKSNSVDVLLVNNVLYFWIRKAHELQAAFEQMYKVLSSGGEARIFPVYTAHQSMFVNNEALETYVNEHFFYRLIQPDYSDEDPYFQDKTSAEVIHLRGCGKKEVQINQILKSKTLILKKL